MLKSSNIDCSVICSNNGNAAKIILEKETGFNLLISDFYMPYANGIELFLFLMKINLDIPFILLTLEDIKVFRKYEKYKNFYTLSKTNIAEKLVPLIFKIT